MRLPLLIVLLSVSCGSQASGDSSGESYCAPVHPCSAMPRHLDGRPDYNGPDGDPRKPWVIGGNTVLNLPPGSYTPAVAPAAGMPAIFVTDDATLRIQNPGGGEVALAAFVIVCDRARFEVLGSKLRFNSQYAFQYGISADHDSAVLFSGATIEGLATTVPPGTSGAVMQTMVGRSTLTVTPDASGVGVRFPSSDDSWQLPVLENARATVDRFEGGLGEFYISGEAHFTVRNSAFFDVFMDVCPGKSLTLENLPALCDLNDRTNGCFTPRHRPVNYSIGPPAAPYTLELTNNKIFSWAATSNAGSSLTMSNIPPLANFAIGLDMPNSLDVKLVNGSAPVATGVSDRTLSFSRTTLGFWHIWGRNKAKIRLEKGSVVGDIIPYGAGTSVTGEDITQAGGYLWSPQGTEVSIDGLQATGVVQNTEGRLSISRGQIPNLLVSGPVYLADTNRPTSGLQLRPGGVLHEVSLQEPADGAVLASGTTNVVGTVLATSAEGAVTPLPPARLQLTGPTRLTVATVTSAKTAEVLGSINADASPPGTYQLTLRFEGAGDGGATSRRTITIPPREGGRRTGCSTAGGGQAGWTLVALLALALPRRRPAPRS